MISATGQTMLLDELNRVRNMAQRDGLPVRRKDGALYDFLSECLGICEHVSANNQEPELREIFRISVDVKSPELWGKGLGRTAGNQGKGRRYAEAGSDVFVLVMRYVMGGEAESNIRVGRSRYAFALREAFKRKISAVQLKQWLTDNGGVNTLYKSRPQTTEVRKTSTLTLNAPIVVPTATNFTVTLRMDHRGFFDALAVSTC